MSSGEKLLGAGDIFICLASGSKDHIGKVAFIPHDTDSYFGGFMGAVRANVQKVNARFLYLLLRHSRFNQYLRDRIAGASINNLSADILLRYEIPLPPLETQATVVAEVAGHQRVIDGARMVVECYRAYLPTDPSWQVSRLGDVCDDILTGPFGSALHQTDYVAHGIPVVNPQDIVDGAVSTSRIKMVSPQTRDRLSDFALREGDIVLGRRGEMGRCAVVSREMSGWLCGTGCFVLRPGKACDSRFVSLQIQSPEVRQRLDQQSVGVTMKNLNQRVVADLTIALPALKKQRDLIAETESEQAIVDANRDLIVRMDKRIQAILLSLEGDEPAVSPLGV